MPYGDCTGPRGQGPGTGRMSGFCGGFNSPGYIRRTGPGAGRGYGRGAGGMGMRRGRGAGGRFVGFGTGFGRAVAFDKEEEMEILKNRALFLKRSQKEIEKRLSELENEN